MKKNIPLLLTAIIFLCIEVQAQNTSPYWSLAGNSNASATTSKLGTTNNIPLRLFANNVERIRIDAGTGFTGVGTISPQQRLHVEGASNQAIFINTSALSAISGSGQIGYVKALPTSTGNRLGYFLVGSRGGAENNYNQAGMSGYAGDAWSASSRPTYLTFETTPSGATSRTERMRIAANGYVGIGTANPNNALHVSGNQTLEGNLNFTSSLQSIQFANPGASSTPMMYMLQSGTANGARVVIGHSPAYPDWGLQYIDDNDQFEFVGGGASRMAINLGSGNVGIGTTNPTYRLSVNGTIQAKEVRVETGWADYVFENGYKLRPLSEVATFIKEHGHLPGVASAKEVQENGLIVGEMQTKMMEKIEELTLYVIELQQQINRLQSEQAKASGKLPKKERSNR